MDKSVRDTLVLEQYMCRECGRFFYINKTDKSDYDIDGYKCPYGCDANGELTRKVSTIVERVELEKP